MLHRFERFSLAITEISRYWHQIAGEEMGKYGLKASHATYLVTLSRFPDGLTAPRLAELCGRDKADVSRMMSILEAKGLAVRDGANRYRGNLRLTPEGQALAEDISQRAQRAVERAGSGLTEEWLISAVSTIFCWCMTTLTATSSLTAPTAAAFSIRREPRSARWSSSP